MIHFLLTILLASLFLFDWLYFELNLGGRVMTWIPEFIAIFIALAIPFRTATEKQIGLPFKYVFLIFLYLGNILAGLVLNDITGWTTLAGLRIYTKFIPVFLAPIIFPFSERAFKLIILWIYGLSMAQLPVVLFQRFVTYATSVSGDPMGGTLGVSASGILAIYLVTIMSFLVAFYFKEEIPLWIFLISGAGALLPITLNETKISFLLVPIAFIFPALFLRAKREAILRVLLILVILAGAFVSLKTIYDYYAERRWGYGIQGFISQPRTFEKYTKRRWDPIVDAFGVGAAENLKFAVFGRGVGNCSEGFTARLTGKYFRKAQFYNEGGMTFPKLVWETGIMGMLLFFAFPVLIFFDARRLARANDGITGAYALGMCSFTAFFSASCFYTFTLGSNVLVFLFFLASGQLVSLSTRLEEDEVSERTGDFSFA